MKGVILSLGSNIEPEKSLPEAWRRLAERFEVEAASPVYRSAAVDSPGASDFHNAAVSLITDLAPAVLKHEVLRPLEAALGRRRTALKSAPRSIDLDLVLYGSLVLDDEAAGLRLPHPDLLTMAYVAVPCADVAPEMRHPLSGETLASIARRLSSSSQVRLVRLRRGLNGDDLGEPSSAESPGSASARPSSAIAPE